LFTGLLAVATASTLRAAEQNKVYRLAVCSQGGMDSFATPFWMLLFNRLPQMGFTEGKNLIVDRYATGGRPERAAGQCSRRFITSALLPG
jgi:putative ABC transport system substrate-binding protein